MVGGAQSTIEEVCCEVGHCSLSCWEGLCSVLPARL